MFTNPLPRITVAVIAAFVATWSTLNAAQATIVRFDTVMGTYDIRLHDALMPISVTNFLNYINSDRYDGTFVHRTVPGFVIQGGGFELNNSIFSASGITTDPAINDEPGGGVAGPSNLRGTIAMAKSGPNTVTSQWFVNLGNNSSLDDPSRSDGGFSAFGRVLGNGMAVVDAIGSLGRISAGFSPYTEVPVLDVQTVLNQGDILDKDAVIVNSVTVLSVPDGDYDFDGNVDSADLLVWQRTLGSTTEAEADGNGNGIVDVADLTILQNNFGTAISASVGQAVPEPSSIALVALAVLLMKVVAASGSRGRERPVPARRGLRL